MSPRPRRDRYEDDDHDDDRPRRPRRGPPPERGGTNVLKVMLGVAGGIAIIGCLGVGGCVVLLGIGARKQAEEERLTPPGDMSLKEFILQKPAKPTAVQVDCQLDTYYNYAFSRCAETHYSFKVEGRSPYASAYGYVAKDSELGRRLYELLKNGSEQKMTVRLQRVGPDGDPLPAGHDSCFALVGVVEGSK
jgi:hypothetical protein